MNFNNAAIVSVKGSDNTVYFKHMSKDDAIFHRYNEKF